MNKILSLWVTALLLCAIETFAGDIVRFGNDVVVAKGTQVGNAVAIGGNVRVDGVVDSDAVAIGGSITVGPEGVIKHSAVSIGGSVERTPTSEIDDVVEINIPGIGKHLKNPAAWAGLVAGLKFLSYIGFLAIALIVLALWPRQIELIAVNVQAEPLKSALWGVAGVIAFLPLMLILLVSIIGILLIPIEVLAFGVAFTFGTIAISVLLGGKILVLFNKASQNNFSKLLIGSIIIWATTWLPGVGFLVKAVVSLIGLGAVLLTIYQSRQKAKVTITNENS